MLHQWATRTGRGGAARVLSTTCQTFTALTYATAARQDLPSRKRISRGDTSGWMNFPVPQGVHNQGNGVAYLVPVAPSSFCVKTRDSSRFRRFTF